MSILGKARSSVQKQIDAVDAEVVFEKEACTLTDLKTHIDPKQAPVFSALWKVFGNVAVVIYQRLRVPVKRADKHSGQGSLF